ncbi:MAG TPA: hypothetical protein VLQ90_04755 [Pyrinomonadaceae bacterium]|nr:hypothetical protein [Pyrinomonadaceae bacterium]
MVEQRNRAIELVANRFLRQTFLQFFNRRLESGKIEIIDRCRSFRKDRQFFAGKLGQTSKYDEPVADASGYRRHNPRAQHRDDRCVAGKDTKIAFNTRQVDLIDLARK